MICLVQYRAVVGSFHCRGGVQRGPQLGTQGRLLVPSLSPGLLLLMLLLRVRQELGSASTISGLLLLTLLLRAGVETNPGPVFQWELAGVSE